MTLNHVPFLAFSECSSLSSHSEVRCDLLRSEGSYDTYEQCLLSNFIFICCIRCDLTGHFILSYLIETFVILRLGFAVGQLSIQSMLMLMASWLPCTVAAVETNVISHHHIKENQGRFPPHLLSMNKHLIESSNSNNLREFVLEIFKAYRLAAITADDQGRIPFSYGMVDWIEGVYGDKNDW